MPAEIWARVAESFMHGSRSTVLKALLYLDAITLFGVVSSPVTKAPTWLQIFLAIAFAAVFLSTLAAYAYFAVKDPDALRSEKFGIDKLAIEKGLVGDNTSGLTRIPAGRLGRIAASTQGRLLDSEEGSDG